MANNSINFNIGFKVNDSGLKQARTALDQFLNNGVNAKQLSLINQQDLNTSLKMIGDATKEVGKFEAAMTQAYNVKLGTVNLERFNEELAKNGTSLQNFKEKMMQLGPTGQQAYAQMASGLMNVKYETVETTTLLDKLGDSLRRALLTFTSINIINKVKGSIGEAYGYVKNLDSSLNDIRIVTGKSADEMDRFAEKANKAAASLGKATTDYTKASTIFYQQGLGNEEVEARTGVALKVANTTGTDTSKTADQLTAIWNGFNVGAEDAEKSIDVVAAVAAKTASNLDEMATAMSKVASMANSMGVSEEQLAAQLSTVIAVTRQAPESVGTAFKTIYARIADIKAGSEDAEISLGNYSGQLSALGINVLDTAGNLKDMGQVIEEVGASWGNYSKEQQVAIAGIMGGQRQVNQIRALFDNWDKYTETMKVAAEAEGTLQQQQDTYMESAEGQLQKLRTEWEGVLDSLLKAEDIIKVAKNISPLIQGFEKVVDALGGGVGILQKFSPLLIGLVSPQISQGIGKMVNSFQAAQTNMKLAQQQAEVWNATMKDTQFTDKYAKSIQSLGADYISLMNIMSAEQKNDFQASMQRFVNVTAGEVSQKLSELNIQYEQLVQQGGIDIVPVNEMDDVDAIQKKLEELKDITLNFPEISFVSKKGKILSGGSTGLSNSIEQAKKEYKELEKIFGADLPPAVERFKKALENVEIKRSRQNVEALKQAYEDLTKDGLRGSTEELEKYKEKIKEYIKLLQEAEQQQGKLNSRIQQLKTEQIVSQLVNVAQGLASIISAIKQFQNLGSIWKNEDLTTSEKFVQTLTTLCSVFAVAVPSIMNMVKAFKLLTAAETMTAAATSTTNGLMAITNLLTKSLTISKKDNNKETLKEISARLLNMGATTEEAAALLIDAGAEEADAIAAAKAAEAKLGLAAANKTLLASFKAFLPVLGALLVAAAAVVAIYAYWTHKSDTSAKAMEKEREKQQEIIDGYENLKKGVEEYSKSVDELHKLTKGTDEYNQALEEQNKKVQELIEKYPDLRAAMRYEGDEMVLDQKSIEDALQKEKEKANEANRKVLKKGLIKDENSYKTPWDVIWQTDEEKQGNITGKGLEINRNQLTEIAKTYKQYEDISSETLSNVIKKYQDMGFSVDEIQDKLENNTQEIKLQSEIIEERNNKFKDLAGIDYTSFMSGDFSSISEDEYNRLIKMSDEELSKIGLTNDEIQEFHRQLAFAKTELGKFPEVFQGPEWSGINNNIKEKFKNLAGTIDDEVLQVLGQGLEGLDDKINIDDFTTDLSNIDWSKGLDGLTDFRKKYGILNEEIEKYIELQLSANVVWASSTGKLQKLSDAIGKISTMKFGDMLSEKDYGELVDKFQGLEKYFIKIGDKYQFVANNTKKVLNELKEAYKEQKKELESLKNDSGTLKLKESYSFQRVKEGTVDRSTAGGQSYIKSVGESLDGIDKKLLSAASGFTVDKITELIETAKDETKELTDEQYRDFEKLVNDIDSLEQIELEKDKEYIYATIQTTKELNEAVQEGTVSQEAADEMFEIVHQREINLLEEQRQKTLDLKKADEEYYRSQKQYDRSKVEKDMESAEGEEWVKLYKRRQELIKEEKDSLERQQAAQQTLLDQHKEDLQTRIEEKATEEELKDIDAARIAQMIKDGDSWAKIEVALGDSIDKNSDTYKTIQEQYELINGEARELEQTTRDINDLEEEYVTKITRANSGLSDSLNVQKDAIQRQMSKTDDRMAHASGQEWLNLYGKKQGEKEQYKGILGTEYNNLGISVQNRKTDLQSVKDYAGNVTFDENGLAILKEGVTVSKDLETAAHDYNDALKERISLGYEIEDLNEKQYVTIDKLASTNAQRTKSERELAKLQREEKGLSGKELLENRKRQREIEQQILEDKKEALKIQKETVEDTKSALTEALLDVNVELDYDENAGILNRTEILEALNGKYDEATIEAITHLMDELDDNTDQLYDLQEEIEDAEQVIAAASDTDENTKIKSNNDRIAQLQREQKKFAEGSSEWYERQKQINEYKADNVNQLESKVMDAAYKDFGGIELQDNNYKLGSSTYLDKYKDYIGSKLENINIGDVELDEFGRIINREKLIANGADADAIDAINEAVDKYMDKVNDLQDAQSDFIANNPYQEVELSVKKAEKSEQDLQKAQQNLTAEVQKTSTAMSQLQSDASFLYGDDLVANLEAQNRCLEEQQRLAKEQVELDKESERIAQEKLTAAEKKKRIDEDALGTAKENFKKNFGIENIEEYIDQETGTLDINKLGELYKDGLPEGFKEAIELYNKALEDSEKSQKEYNAALKESQDAQNKTLQDLAAENKLTNDILNKRREIAQAKLKTAEDAIKRETSADHKLSKALLDVDEAINKVKRSQNGLTGPALISAMQQEVALQQQKKTILEQQKAQIDAQIQSLIKLYSLHLSTEYGISVGFNVDETGVTNVDALYKSIEKLDEKVKGAAMQDIQNFISTLNGLAGNALSAKKSVDGLGDSIEDLNKKIEDTQKAELFRVKEERWSNIDQELKKIARELSRVEKLQKNLTGDALIKNLEHQQQLLEKQAEAQKNKLGIMKAELQTMQTMLALEGVLFTSDGLIANYAAVMAKGNEKLNGYMQSYQQFYDQIGDLEDSILDTYDKKADLEAEKMAERLRMFNTKIDIELDLTKAKREWQNFKREFLNTLNDMSRLNDSIAEKCKQNVKDIKDMTVKDTVMLTDHVNDIIQEIKIMQAGGTSDLYGIDQATALSDLANYRQQLQDTLSSLADKIKETEEAFLQQLEKIKSKFDDQIGNYETIQSIIEHDMNLIKLLRGDDAYDELANYYDKSTKNYEAELQSLRQQVDYWKALMSEAQPGTEEWEKFQANWKDALNKLNSAVDAAVQNLLDKYKNAINKVISDFEKKITNGSSLDTAKQRWDWQKEEADFYLDEITKIYNIEKLRMKINDAANDEADPAKKAKILQIGEKQIKQLESLTKVRQYDVDLANKQLELELKKQELEDAKNQKTLMRLRRDAEGNYRYEYVADQDKIEELRESILDAEQDIYEFTVKNQRDLQDRMYENVKAFEDAIRDLESRRLQMTQDEYEAELQRIKDHFGYMDDAVRSALDKAGSDVTDAAITEAIDLGILFQEQVNQMSDIERRAFAEDIVPTFISAITEMKEIIDGEGGLVAAAKNAFDELDNVFDELEAGLNEIQSAAGVDFDAIIAGIDDTINEMQALIEDNDELLVQYQEELDIIRDLIDELHDLMDAYRDVYDAAMQAIDVALELRETAREAMEEYNDLNSMANDTGGAAANTGTSGGVPAGNYAASKNSISKKGKTNNTELDYITYIDENGEAHTAKLGTNISTSSLQDGKLHSLTVKDSKGNKQTVQHTQILFTGSKDKAQERATGWDTTWGEQNTDTQINDITYKGERADNWKWDEKLKKFVPAFATGGYTGSWGNEGKIAILHEKELVLNQDDTKNILRAVAQVRANTQMGLSPNDFNTLSNMMVGIHNVISDIYAALVNNSANTLMQQAAAASTITSMNSSNVTNNINANFPNAGNMNEIKSAIMGLQNYTSQKIHSNQRVKSTTTPNAYRAKSF